MSSPVIAIVGATGAVGVEILKCLDERRFPFSDLRLLASARSKGRTIRVREKEITVEELSDDSLKGVDIAFFSAGGSISRALAPRAAGQGTVVIDNSSAFRLNPEVPLVIPEINPGALSEQRGIISNPNCSTIIALMVVWPIHKTNRVTRLIISTYQAASGAGASAMEELIESTRAHLDGRPFQPRVFPNSLAFNVFCHNTAVDPDSGYNEEEIKLRNETRKILGDPTIRVSATCVRVPVLRAHSESINAEFERPISAAEVRKILEDAPGVRVVDDRGRNHFPMPKDASGQDDVLVGRIREDVSDPSGRSIAMFVAGDQLLKGAALNAVQIAELLPVRNGQTASRSQSR
jgi:aspartate-semialdehyde dehydrogenase